jgi:hypothetical protein
MTSLEHVSVKHALDRLPSWTGDGDVAETWGEVEVEEVSFGVAVTTPDDEGEEEVGIALGGDEEYPRAENSSENRNEDGNGNGNGSGSCEDHEEGGGGGVGSGSGGSPRSSIGVSPPGLASRSRSRSESNSNSRSRSSVRGALEMGESSAATSWTQADADGVGTGMGEPSSGDEDSERPPSDEAHCRSSADRLEPGEEVIDVGAVGESRTPREATDAVSLSVPRTGPDGRGGGGKGGDVSRKEEVLVVQEEDIGEGWHPLRYNGKARSQDDGEGEGEKGEAEEDVGSACALESGRGGDQSLEMNEKERWGAFGSSGRNARHLRLEFKPPSPQPWDEVDPPADNNEMYASDYYSTLNSKKFGTLQKRCVYADVLSVLLIQWM